jgi:hypothetical protein
MSTSTPDRREFLAASMHAFGGAWLALLLPEIEAAGAFARLAAARGEPLATFTPAEARTFEAAAATIFPDDDTPGAVAAGVVHFADRALGTFLSQALEDVRAGLRDLDARARGTAGAASFADLPAEARAGVFREFEATPHFFNMRLLSVAGMFSDPSHGGNRDGAGWRLLRIEHAPLYQPPFGYYDAEAAGQTGGGDR